MISDKRILFIGPIFHSYHTAIIRKLEEAGATVSFFPERKYGLLFKAINNFRKKYLERYQEKHYDKILQQIGTTQYDVLFVIRGYMLPDNFVRRFKQMNPRAQTIMYQWDSNKSNPFLKQVANFDKVFSFDFDDCDHNPKLKYLPLFYIDDVAGVARNKTQVKEYDFFFMGWYFPKRYEALMKFKEYADAHNYKLKAFLFIPFTTYVKERLDGKRLDRSVISTRPMKRAEYLENLVKSDVMVDVSNPDQTGLAMRIIEAFACRTKVLTNNYKLQEDKFYSSEYVAFFDEDNPKIDEQFLRIQPTSPPANMYTVKEWLMKMFAEIN